MLCEYVCIYVFFIRLRTACLWQAVPRLLAVDECESKSRGAVWYFLNKKNTKQADSACKLAWTDNPDEYAEIIEENFGISTNRGILRSHPAMVEWSSISQNKNNFHGTNPRSLHLFKLV